MEYEGEKYLLVWEKRVEHHAWKWMGRRCVAAWRLIHKQGIQEAFVPWQSLIGGCTEQKKASKMTMTTWEPVPSWEYCTRLVICWWLLKEVGEKKTNCSRRVQAELKSSVYFNWNRLRDESRMRMVLGSSMVGRMDVLQLNKTCLFSKGVVVVWLMFWRTWQMGQGGQAYNKVMVGKIRQGVQPSCQNMKEHHIINEDEVQNWINEVFSLVCMS